MTAIDLFYMKVQTTHTVFRNFGIMGQVRCMIESVGPEFPQNLFMSDRKEHPLNQVARGAVYKRAKGAHSVAAFGSLGEFASLVEEAKRQDIPPDYISMASSDGATAVTPAHSFWKWQQFIQT